MRLVRIDRVIRSALAFSPQSNLTLAYQLERLAGKKPDHPFLLYQDRRYTYAEANALINRHAHAFRKAGIGKGDVVALDLENRPEFLWHFFALGKIGAVASLINTSLAGEILLHSLRICKPKCLIIGSELWSNFGDVLENLDEAVRKATFIDIDPENPAEAGLPRWNDRLADAPESNPPESSQQVLTQVCAYIYTSGTTGKPKAALITHLRFYRAGLAWSSAAFRLTKSDVLYVCLPLYHSNGILLAVSSVVTAGATVALSRRFSASRFWDEIRRFEATGFIYIGELCRYLMNRPPDARDKEHKVRVISGNGLRPELWKEFQERFGLERISEFYASTEGNVVSINAFGVEGSVGRMIYLSMALVKWDSAEQRFVRGARGRLIRCPAGETGMLLGKINRRNIFDGYEDREATESKIVRNAFEPGDAWFNTGDLLRRDWLGNLFFVDRVGDTFRWKGQNVSTFEVEEQIVRFSAAREVAVYGVKIEGSEGQAPMAAVALKDGAEFDPRAFKQHVDHALPDYARPLIVRLCAELEVTGTFKIKKTELQRQGYDPDLTEDALHVRDPESDAYVRMSRDFFERILRGRIKW